MASQRSRTTPALSSRSEDAGVQLPHRSVSTRLPMPKQSQKQPTSNTSLQHSPSKLTKRRPSKAAEDGRDGHLPNIRDGAHSKSMHVKGSKSRTQRTQIAESSSNARELPKSTVAPQSSSRAIQADEMSARTPSLISGSSVSTSESPRSNVLRHKPSSIGRSTSRLRKASVTSQDDTAVMDTLNVLGDPFPDSILGVAMPVSTSNISHSQLHGTPITLPMHLEQYSAMPSMAYPDAYASPAPLYALSTTPSTGYSASPGPFSVASTPTSASSYSPGTATTYSVLPRVAQSSPIRGKPPMLRRRTEESEDRTLSSVRESSASSSGSTARASSVVQQRSATQPYPVNARPRLSYDRKADKTGAETRPKTTVPPPELAHLVDATPLQRPPIPSSKPTRPSREGTPDYSGLRDPSPVVQSNLQRLPSATHRRQTSMESRGSGTSSAPAISRSRIAPPTKLPSRNPSPSPSQMSIISPTSSRPPFGRGMTPDPSSDTEGKGKKGVAPSQSPGKSGSRFGFFRRKTEPVPESAKPVEKKSRKGPAAGTGHEGYGKYGFARGRSGSTTSGGSSGGRSPSADSGTGSALRAQPSRKSSVTSKGNPEIDDFLRERLTPVPLRGEGLTMTEGYKAARPVSMTSTSEQSFTTTSTAPLQQLDSATTSVWQQPVLKATAPVQAPRTQSPTKRDRSVPPDTQSSGRFGLRSLGGKRLSRVSVHMEGPPPQLPSTQARPSNYPKSLQGQQAPPAPSQKFSKQAAPKPPSAQPILKQPAKLSRKWNFFQRAHAAPVEPIPTLEPSPEIQHQASLRSTAHYALAEDQGKIGMDELEQIMQEANASPDDETDLVDESTGNDPGIQLLPEDEFSVPIGESTETHRAAMEVSRARAPYVRSMLLPDRPIMPPPGFEVQKRSASPVVQLRRESTDLPVLLLSENVQPTATPVADRALDSGADAGKPPTAPLVPLPPQRQPRLQQVGRIPQVKRDRERKLSIHSFSRPFGTDGTPALQQQSPLAGGESPQAEQGLNPPALNDVVAQLRIQSFAEDVEAALDLRRHSSQTATTIDPSATDGIEEFLTFPPRKESNVSVSTSSGYPSFGTVAVTAPESFPQAVTSTEDEIWGEYDDLIDDVLWTPEMVGSHGGGRPAPLTLTSRRASRLQRPEMLQPQRAGHVPSLPPIATPNSPYSVTDFLAAYGVRGLSMLVNEAAVPPLNGPTVRASVTSTQLSAPSTSHNTASSRPVVSQATTETSSPLVSATMQPTQKAAEDRLRSQHDADDTSDCQTSSSIDDEDDDPASLAKLRFSALMTSKWLSFGRVLFSPAHNELKDPREDRVLVVDGLGKDWSHYVALTYHNASVYSLGPEPSAFPSTRPGTKGGPIEQMPNHRHIHHPNLHAPFPFPKGFFAAVVFRFPSIASESAYRMALAESKRVLRPGGYLEVSVLDMDPVNMGHRARTAVKGLKMRIAQQHPDWSLKPMSDVVMKLVGARGFENLQRCVVGVPAAGSIRRSDDGAVEPSALATPAQPSVGNAPDGPSAAASTLSDLIRHDGSAETAPGMSHMVCKVGRWWYDRCYESAIAGEAPTSGPQQSIWRDGMLLAECERLNTTFRLLICCAQKPTGAVRRTVSV